MEGGMEMQTEKGSGGALAAIYQRRIDMVYRICFTYMKERLQAEDAAQETFLRLLDSGAAFSDEEQEKAWLIVTARNVCKNELRRRRRGEVPLDSVAEPAAEQPELDETLQAVLQLPERQKIAIYLHYYEGYSAVQIGKLFKRPANTVRSDLRRGREALRRTLGGGS